MVSKKWKNLLIIGLALIVAIAITAFFLLVYLDFGSYSRDDSLFYLLTKVDYAYLIPYFLGVALSMLVLDTLVVLMRYYWHDFNKKISRPIRFQRPTRGRLRAYWRKYRAIHLTFILLTIFLTIAISGPASIMNTFTAIVSISVLVSNLTKN